METPPLPPAGVAVGRNFLKLGAGEAAARLIAFGATVYMARTLGASMYGVVVLATTILLYLSALTDGGVEALGIRDVAADPQALAQALPSILGGRLIVGVVLISITAIAGLAILPQPDGGILAAYVFTLGTVALSIRWIHLGFENPGYASMGRVLSEVTNASLIVVLVHGPADLASVPIAQVVGEGIGAIVLWRLLPAGIRNLPFTMRASVVRGMFRASWPLILNSLLGLAIFNSDFLFLRGFRDSAAVGLYAAAYTLVSFFLNLGAAYTMSLLPPMTRLRHDATAARALYDRSMVQVLAGAIPIATGGFLIAGPVIAMVFGARYGESAAPLRILMLSIPAALIRNVAQSVLVGYGRQDQLLHTAIWATAINLLLNLTLIPVWGLIGAAVATLATEVIRTVLAVRYVDRLGIPMTSITIFRRVLAASAVMAVPVVLLARAPVPAIVAAGLVTYAGTLTLVGGLRFRRGALPEICA